MRAPLPLLPSIKRMQSGEGQSRRAEERPSSRAPATAVALGERAWRGLLSAAAGDGAASIGRNARWGALVFATDWLVLGAASLVLAAGKSRVQSVDSAGEASVQVAN